MAAQAGRNRPGRGLNPAWAAVPLGLLVTALTIAGLVAIASAGRSEGQLIRLMTVLSSAAIGTLVASRRPGNPFGWLMLSAGLFLSVSDGAVAYSVLDYQLHRGRLPLGRLAVGSASPSTSRPSRTNSPPSSIRPSSQRTSRSGWPTVPPEHARHLGTLAAARWSA
jgi:hypothetical protein